MAEPTDGKLAPVQSSLAALSEAAAAGPQLLELPLDAIEPDPDQPRSNSGKDDQGELDSLAENIRELGVLQPIRVRSKPEADGYFIVVGERRWRACRIAGRETVPAIVETEDRQNDARLLVQISENLQRSDLRLLDLAEALEKLRSSSELSDGKLARRLGRSKAWFSQHRRALRAKGLAREALDEHLVRSAETLRRLEKLPDSRQRQLLRAARKSGAPIPRGAVDATSEPAQKTKRRASGDNRSPPTANRSVQLYSVQLSATDLRRLILALGGEPADSDGDLVPALRGLLRQFEST